MSAPPPPDPPRPSAGRGRAALLNLAKLRAAQAAAGPDGDAKPIPVQKSQEASPPKEPGAAPTVGRGRAFLLAKLAQCKAKSAPAPAPVEALPAQVAPDKGQSKPSTGDAAVASKLEAMQVSKPLTSTLAPSASADEVSFTTAKSEVVCPPKTSPRPKSHDSAYSGAPRAMTLAPTITPSTATLYRGEGGKRIAITANYIRLDVCEGRGVFEHEVQFDPRVDSRDERFRLLKQLQDTIGKTRVFDGNKLFLPCKLSEGRTELTSVDSQTGSNVKVTIIFKRERVQGDPDLIYLYNNLFNKVMRTLKLIQHNRKFFDPRAAQSLPAFNLSVWPGYATAVDRFEGGLLLQLDGASRVLRTETVYDFLVSIKKRSDGANFKVEVEKGLLGQSVLTRYNNKSYIVDDIDFDLTPKASFTNEKGVTLTYLQYYENQYGIKIADQNQPLLVHRPRKKAIQEEGVQCIICLVPELCLMTGLTDAMRADFRLMKEVGNFTRLSPARRQEVLQTFIKTIRDTPEAKAHLKDWGLRPSSTTMPLEGRVLEPEVLYFGGNYKERVGPNADWGRAATSKNCLTAVPINKWAIIFLQKNQPVVKNFVMTLQQQGPRMGITVAAPKVIGLANDRIDTYLKAVRDVVDPSTQLVLTVFPQMRSDRYAAIKKLCCIEKPVASQVVNLRTISNEKRVQSVVQKIALQINCKLGGELWGCAAPFKDLMVVGIDVYHDKSRKGGSVAGVVVSLNDNFSRYFSRAQMQAEGQEIMDTLKIAFVDGLIRYWEVNHRWPAHIVVFRDGVGDGQLEVTEKYEAEQFISAFAHVKKGGVASSMPPPQRGLRGAKLQEMLPKDYNPGFTFVVVQKRINTRIYTCVQKGVKTEFDNPPPGTILDHTVTRFKYKDFFLVPQTVNQGTVNPTHYIVVRELGMEPEARINGQPVSTLEAKDVQKLAYKLSHMYFNWPGTVRVPSPVQYAHKLVDLVGQHIRNVPNPQLDDKLFYL